MKTQRWIATGALVGSLLLGLGLHYLASNPGDGDEWPLASDTVPPQQEGGDRVKPASPNVGAASGDGTTSPVGTSTASTPRPAADAPEDESLRFWDTLSGQQLADSGGNGAYEGLVERLFGEVPDNPVGRLAQLDESALAEIMCGDAAMLGRYIGFRHAPEQWLSWLEALEKADGLAGQVTSVVLQHALRVAGVSIRADAAQARRVLAYIDRTLHAWHGTSMHHLARFGLMKAFHEICPVDGGMSTVRQWVVETPFGDEVIEMMLTQSLRFWPLSQALPLALEALDSRGAGAIKGILNACLLRVESERSRWSEQDVRVQFGLPIATAVMDTSHPSAIQLAAAWATSSPLASYADRIGRHLLNRRDDVLCSALGFSFLATVSPDETGTLWRNWVYSAEPYLVEGACIAATGTNGEIVTLGDAELNRLAAVAAGFVEWASVRASAANALSYRDHVRALAVFREWAREPAIEDLRLVAMGRMTRRLPSEGLRAALEAAIADATAPADRRNALFLLSLVEPITAIDFCRRDFERAPRLLDDETILLICAAVQALAPTGANADAASAIRARIHTPEPDWMRDMRLQLNSANPVAEQRIVGFLLATGR